MDWNQKLLDELPAAVVAGLVALVVTFLVHWISRWWNRPLIQLSFERSSCELTNSIAIGGMCSNEFADEIYFRLQVRNAGLRTLRGCRVWLSSVERLNGSDLFQSTLYRDTLPLVWSYDDSIESVDLPPDVPRHFDVAVAAHGHEGISPRLRGMNAPRHYQSVFSGFDAWKLGVLVSGEDIHPVQGNLIIRHFPKELAAERFYVV